MADTYVNTSELDQACADIVGCFNTVSALIPKLIEKKSLIESHWKSDGAGPTEFYNQLNVVSDLLTQFQEKHGEFMAALSNISSEYQSAEEFTIEGLGLTSALAIGAASATPGGVLSVVGMPTVIVNEVQEMAAALNAANSEEYDPNSSGSTSSITDESTGGTAISTSEYK